MTAAKITDNTNDTVTAIAIVATSVKEEQEIYNTSLTNLHDFVTLCFPYFVYIIRYNKLL